MSLTKLSAVMADSGVRVGDGKMRVCNRCQADLGNELTTCPECGAHVVDSTEVEPMSTTFDAELAMANVLRMRGEFKKAQDICLSVLKRFPNSNGAHTLLGDIYSDQGLLEQAAQWYELALDLDKTSIADRQKLDDVREQMKERDHISSIEQLGLPESKKGNFSNYWYLGAAAVVLLLGVVYAARHGKIGSGGEPAVITTPIKATADMLAPAIVATAANVTKPPVTAPTNPTPADDNPNNVGAASEDKVLFQLLVEKSSFGADLVSVLQDPRTKSATLTYSIRGDEDERQVGAMLAKAALEQSPDAQTITVRSMKNDKLSYMADVPRLRYLETLSTDWQAKAGSSDAWIGYVLTNEWPPKPVTDGSTDTPPANSGGSGTSDSKGSDGSKNSDGSTGSGTTNAESPNSTQGS